jgi:hypothetical protein
MFNLVAKLLIKISKSRQPQKSVASVGALVLRAPYVDRYVV